MATYNKRGYKAPKPEKPEDDVVEAVPVEETVAYDGNSTTAEVFNSLDEGASKTEEWVQKNQKSIFVVVGVVALITIGYLLFDKFVDGPKEEEAANEMFQAEQYFTQAVNAQKSQDSLYNLALNGGEGKFGFLAIIDKYSGTDAANLAHYFAGTAYLNTGKYKDAVEHLEDFKTKDEILKATALGATGDAFVQLGTLDEGLKYYLDAAKVSDNDVLTPRFLFKAAQVSLEQKKKDDALKYFKEIKEKYSASTEGAMIDAYIAELE
ncbi:tetratricopeptide repeat protein [Flavobacterium sp. Sd200]|uniref:tetratricopeptide repeat protein n=1 Tax=Flavobacterium sp. Sd200 TaxID=2692211 RepID=UPI00136D2E44|nr:tetratricopeptide repeat protein [Flavobacterium sp. Sd200]MXN91636.1 tetratricopeptide repeat protein [Flavobacterium sp. Sd200]